MSKLYSEIDIGPGFCMEMVRAGMDALKGALRRLRHGRQTDGIAPFSAPVVYVQPELDVLTCRFPGRVNPYYKGARFDPIERCKGVPTNVGNREVAFEIVRMKSRASRDMMLVLMDREGLRPALYEELLGFALKHPDEQRRFPIVALGSETIVHGDRYVAYLWHDGDGRRLGLCPVDNDWHDRSRFLAVPM